LYRFICKEIYSEINYLWLGIGLIPNRTRLSKNEPID